jgi:membrane associated rhomboid family serine protease
VLTLFFIILVPIPAFIILGYWFVIQFVTAMGEVGTRVSGGVAVWAHVGGFLLGVLVTLLLRKSDY